MNRTLDHDLFDWVGWWGGVLDGGYPGRTPLGRLLDEGWSSPPPRGSSVPKGAMIKCPPHVARLNGVMDKVPDHYNAILRLRYIDRQKLKSVQWSRLRELHAFVEGALAMVN